MGIFNLFKKSKQNVMPEPLPTQEAPIQNELSNQIKSIAKDKLILYFSHDIVDRAFRSFNIYYRIEGLCLTVETDFGRRMTIAQAKDYNELLFNVIKELSETCAKEYELIHRENNSKKWHYLRSKVINGYWMYKENSDYKYDAIEDTRKIWFEKHIGAMATVYSIKDIDSLILKYTSLMNMSFVDSHWSFDTDLMEFIEISSSKKRDTNNQEHPQPNEILK
ncbi:MAG: hypothetical protein IKB50_00345 [Clostridia bacterium]|nr:hypothetical protein [Clostridia bacterium]